MYWFIRNPIDRQIQVCFPNRNLQNMDAFLAMSRHGALRQILEDLSQYEGGAYHACPGEYLELSVEDHRVTARICICYAVPCAMRLDFFQRLVTEYLAEWDVMLHGS